jgi:hypothetical protein
MRSPLSQEFAGLDRLYVFCLPPLRALGHVKLDGLTLLQALETASLDRGEMHENVFAILTADEAVAFSVIEPLYCSLFCHVLCTLVSFFDSYAGGIRKKLAQVTGC